MVDHRHVEWDCETQRITTSRLVLRHWQLDDDLAARAIYGAPEVARWLCPVLPPIADSADMRRILASWIGESDATGLPLGRWAITDKASGEVIGGVALLPLPPGGADLEIGWQLVPKAWGGGYGAEAGHAVAHQAFENPGITEGDVFEYLTKTLARRDFSGFLDVLVPWSASRRWASCSRVRRVRVYRA